MVSHWAGHGLISGTSCAAGILSPSPQSCYGELSEGRPTAAQHLRVFPGCPSVPAHGPWPVTVGSHLMVAVIGHWLADLSLV